MLDVTRFQQQYADLLTEINPTHIVGVDEVGFGAMAGPCTIGGVGIPIGWRAPKGLTDSKLLSERQRSNLSSIFLAEAATNPQLVHYLCDYSSEEIDQRGLGRCRSEGLAQAVVCVCALLPKDARLLAIVDGNLNLPHSRSIPKADLIVPAVSMASVLAKVSRDTWMVGLDAKHPGYDFKKHKGYDTAMHRQKLKSLGPCPIHRRSNATVARSIRPPQEGVEDFIANLDS